MICLDIGNVLVDTDFSEFIKELGESRDIDPETVWSFLSRIQAIQDLGITTMKQELETHFSIKKTEKYLEAWNKSFKPNKTSIAYLEKMIDAGVTVALLSNIGYEHSKLMPKLLGDVFDSCIKHFSCEVGARKPTKLYYQSFLMDFPQFYGSVYVDDRFENLQTGTYYGFESYHLDTTNLNETDLTNQWESIFDLVR